MSEKEENDVTDLVKLKAMERDVKKMCNELDARQETFNKESANLEKQIAAFNKKHKIVGASDSFNKMVVLVDEIYTMYVGQHGDAGGLYESIKLLLDSRARFSEQPKKK
jgi:hypothetical protein